MIGVIPKPDEIPVVEEFFQLFKTPWELYEPGRPYDVVLVTADHAPRVAARLSLIYGAHVKSSDARDGLEPCSRSRGASITFEGTPLPIYDDVITFAGVPGGTPCVMAPSGAAGLRMSSADGTVIRLGYDLFREVKLLLSAGQPVEHAHIPTLDLHVAMLRRWMIEAGIRFPEIAPAPAERRYLVCLTHDIDFVGIRDHWLDHSMWGFLYRSTVGAVGDVLRRRISVARLLKIWQAVVSLPFVYLGWARDFWSPFEWYLRTEEGLGATYFLIPFKGCPGERVPGRNSSRRATRYDVSDLPDPTRQLMRAGCEIGVHGIDAWHSVEKGRAERAQISSATGEATVGIRMHWLLRDDRTLSVLEESGYAYDSSCGYNETIGYFNGTSLPFRPLGARAILELPMHIQDGALFYRDRLDLSEPEAWVRCTRLVDNARKLGGVLTLLWHDRSHGPERFWGEFYRRLVETLKADRAWFGTAGQVVGWFRKRRDVRFERIETASGAGTRVCYDGERIEPPLSIRLYGSPADGGGIDREMSWNGDTSIDLDPSLARVFPPAADSIGIRLCSST